MSCIRSVHRLNSECSGITVVYSMFSCFVYFDVAPSSSLARWRRSFMSLDMSCMIYWVKLRYVISGLYTTAFQGVSQDLELGCPNLLEISKQGVQIVHLQYFYM